MYDLVGRCVADMAAYADQAADFPIYWNPPGWGSVTDRDGLQRVFGALLDGEWMGAMIVGLKPHGVIPLHTDDRDRITERVHVVLATNPGCWNFHDGQWHRLAIGGIYRMDETKTHASVNLGSTTRLHLVVDRLP